MTGNRGGTRTRRSSLVGGLAATGVALLAVAAPAVAAPTLNADRQCYVENQPAELTGSGYTPNGEVVLSFGVLVGSSMVPEPFGALSTTADAAGNISLLLRTPELASRDDVVETVVAAATDQQQAAQGVPPLVTTQWSISLFDAFVGAWEGGRAHPRETTTFYAFGFGAVGGKTLYAHYLLGGKLRKTVTIGRLTGRCGNLRIRMREFPFRPVPAGVWRVEIDASRTYPNSSPAFVYRKVRVSKSNAVR